MELYVLDDQLRRIAVVDMYESLIWSERFNDAGDFELTVYSTIETRTLLAVNTMLTIDKSFYVMQIETVEKKVDADGRAVLQISGPSIEAVMKDRVAKDTFSSLTTDPSWEITGTPIAIAKKIFKDICILGQLKVADIIPFIVDGDFLATPGSWYAMDPDLVWNDALGVWEDAYGGYVGPGDGDSAEEITILLQPQTVFKAIQDLCIAYGLGFRLVRNYDKSELYFDIYTGTDRSTFQDDLPPVQFSADLDNLQDSTELSSTTGSKNVAYVFSKNGGISVAIGGADPTSISGFNRRVLYVDATDIELAAGTALTAALQQRGYEALAANKELSAFDGEISKFGAYKYGVDFNLGDLVELKSSDGTIAKMRVTEQIFIHDVQGEREYPTLVSDMVVDPEVWYGAPASLEWNDVDSAIYWGNFTGEW